MLIIKNRINKKLNYNGIDSLNQCLNKTHFKNYKKDVSYHYNSRGFRDKEWPKDLSKAIWCVGDSFTVGLGQPFEETWPYLLQKKLNKRCLNLGEDGCSNDTISLRAEEIYKLYKPKLIVIMWSYLNRRRINNKNMHFDKNDFGIKADFDNFIKNCETISKLKTKIIQTIIPNVLLDPDKKIFNYLLLLRNKFKILNFPQLDYARDYHHFDVKTSEYLVNLVTKKINDFDK
jgi:hypothetical protein